MAIANVGGEELNEAIGGTAARGGEQRGYGPDNRLWRSSG
jgi:hypothetical protein